MAAWPDTRLTTYVANSVPAIKAADLNAFQDAIGDVSGQLNGVSRFGLAEEFLQTSGSAGTLTITSFPTQLGVFSAYGDVNAEMRLDSTSTPGSGDFGILNINSVNGSAAVLGVQTGRFGLSTRDYHFAARAAVVTKAKLNVLGSNGFIIGLSSTDRGHFLAGNDSSTWRFIDAAGGSHDTGVTVVDGTMVVLEIKRASGTVTALINGSSVYTGSDTVDMNPCFIVAGVNGLGSFSAHGTYAAVDYMHFGPVLRP